MSHIGKLKFKEKQVSCFPPQSLCTCSFLCLGYSSLGSQQSWFYFLNTGFLFIYFFGHASQLVGSQFPNQGSNPGPRHFLDRQGIPRGWFYLSPTFQHKYRFLGPSLKPLSKLVGGPISLLDHNTHLFYTIYHRNNYQFC